MLDQDSADFQSQMSHPSCSVIQTGLNKYLLTLCAVSRQAFHTLLVCDFSLNLAKCATQWSICTHLFTGGTAGQSVKTKSLGGFFSKQNHFGFQDFVMK